MIHKDIEKLINNWDPANLFEAHVPFDEYSMEIKKIAEYCEVSNSDFNTLAQYIYILFVNSFGKDIFKKNIDDCIVIAKEILRNK